MAQKQLSPQELAAIASQFSNPPAVDDSASEMCGRIPPNAQQRMMIPPPVPMPNRPGQIGGAPDGFVPDSAVEDHATIPQDGVGVPTAKMVDPNNMPRPESYPTNPYAQMGGGGYPQHDQVSVYEDNGQKFMIKNGCIFKQTWTTVENGGEFRMFDYRKGKKVSPKGIVIQKYDWIPLSVANAISSSTPKRKPATKTVAAAPAPVSTPKPESTQEPQIAQEQSKPEPAVEQKPASENKQEPKKEVPAVVKKIFKPLEKPVAKPAATKEDVKKPVAPKKASPKVHNAGILKK